MVELGKYARVTIIADDAFYKNRDTSATHHYGLGTVNVFRALILDHRKLALMLLALTLCVKALVPAGFMVERKGVVLTVSICAGTQETGMTQQIIIPMKQDPASHGDDQGKRDGNCAFMSLGFGALAAVDPALLAGALLFILALGFIAPVQRRHVALLRLLPPAQGPPLFG
jgi:hypothetical protein